jgi:hypothetical protein
LKTRTDYSPAWKAAFRQHAVEGDSGECWLWQGPLTARGYGRFQATPRHRVLAHRYSYWLANGYVIPTGLVVCHRCDNPQCWNPDHLFAGTQVENLDDMTRKGRRVGVAPTGDANGRTKIASADIPLIKIHHGAGVSCRELARRYDVAPSTIARIITGERHA